MTIIAMTTVAITAILPISPAAQSSPPRIEPQDARKHHGIVATVCGVVTAMGCTDEEGTHLDLGSVRSMDRATGRMVTRRSDSFAIVIPPGLRSAFGTRVEDRFHRRTVCATGRIERKGSEHQIVAKGPEDLAVEQEPTPIPPVFAPNAHRPCDPHVELPKLRKDVKPAYSPDAMRAHVEGSVFMQGVVEADGTVGEVEVLTPLHPDLDRNALVAFKRWRFQPGKYQGRAAPTIVIVEMTFKLRGDGGAPFRHLASHALDASQTGISRCCEVRFVPIWIEVRILPDVGGLLYSRIFANAEEAMAWAEEEREELRVEGWTEVSAG